MNCCCNYGAAIAGEWPEFECKDCKLHKNSLNIADSRCKTHHEIYVALLGDK